VAGGRSRRNDNARQRVSVCMKCSRAVWWFGDDAVFEEIWMLSSNQRCRPRGCARIGRRRGRFIVAIEIFQFFRASMAAVPH